MFARAVLVLTAIWFALAAWHFTIHPARTLARTTSERPVSVQTTELFRFLGGFNASLAVLALVSLRAGPAAWPVFLTLMLANLSQFLVDIRVKRMGLVRGRMFLQIFIGDALFAVLNGAALALAFI